MILFEKHNIKDCWCNYCAGLRDRIGLPFGFWSPKDKSWNSWRILWFKGSKNAYYIRWTGFWFIKTKRILDKKVK